MAEKGVQLDRETFSCSICLDLLRDPVTVPCGHSYCMDCIKNFWDGENEKEIYSCPQCRQTYNPRPVLLKNTMLAVLVEQLKKTGLQTAPADHCYAGPEDVACDVCTGRKLKAVKSCLVCLISYCEQHLQPHYQSPAFEKHKLVEPFKKLQENICSLHGEAMTMFCRSDQQCICYICPVDKHKGHITVSAATERTEKKIKLDLCLKEFKQGIQAREKDVKVLKQEAEAINRSADKAVNYSEKTFAEMIRLIKKRSSEVKQQVRSQQESEVARVKELQEKLEKEISELKAKDAELKLQSHIEDHTQFLHNYPKLSQLIESKLILGYKTEVSDKLQVKHLSTIKIRPLRYFEDVTAAVSEVRDKLQVVLTETETNISLTVTEVDVLISQPEPKTRDGFLRFSREITPDPNTADPQLSISGRQVTLIDHQSNSGVTVNSYGYGYNATYDDHLSYSSEPNRSTDYLQVQSTESLTGRCYLELEWKGERVDVAVAYKNISGPNYECGFGQNQTSWALDCYQDSCTFWYNNGQTPVSGPPSSRIGVYLDHRAGILSFYNVSETMTLLHRVQTKFTAPLYAGLRLNSYGDTAEFIKPT